MDLLQELVRWLYTPGADLLLVQNFPPGSDFVDDSISPDPGMGSQSSIGFDVEARSNKLCLIMLLFWPVLALSSTLSSSGKFSMAVVSTVVVDPENELIDSVAN